MLEVLRVQHCRRPRRVGGGKGGGEERWGEDPFRANRPCPPIWPLPSGKQQVSQVSCVSAA